MSMKGANSMSTITVDLTIKVKKQIHFLQCRKYPMDSSHHRCQMFTCEPGTLENRPFFGQTRDKKFLTDHDMHKSTDCAHVPVW